MSPNDEIKHFSNSERICRVRQPANRLDRACLRNAVYILATLCPWILLLGRLSMLCCSCTWRSNLNMTQASFGTGYFISSYLFVPRSFIVKTITNGRCLPLGHEWLFSLIIIERTALSMFCLRFDLVWTCYYLGGRFFRWS